MSHTGAPCAALTLATAQSTWRPARRKHPLLYGGDVVRGTPSDGTPETIQAMSVDDVRAFWKSHGVPDGARLSFVGNLDARRVKQLLRTLSSRWRGRRSDPMTPAVIADAPRFAARTGIYLVDKPGAPQSEIRIGHPGVSAMHEDYYALSVMNHALGGSFSSRINLNLREDKGYTYGARSRFRGGRESGTFTASAGVRTNVTAESVTEFMKELEGILSGPTAEELAFTRDALVQAMNRQQESTWARQGMLETISQYGLADDYLVERRAFLDTVTRGQLEGLARKYVHPDRAWILVVGDKATVKPKLEALGHGPVTELDVRGAAVATGQASALAR